MTSYSERPGNMRRPSPQFRTRPQGKPPVTTADLAALVRRVSTGNQPGGAANTRVAIALGGAVAYWMLPMLLQRNKKRRRRATPRKAAPTPQ